MLEIILQWTVPVWREAIEAATRGGHTHVLRWAFEREGGRGPWTADFDDALQIAATCGHLDVVKWLLERGVDGHTSWKMEDSAPEYYELMWRHQYCIGQALEMAAEHNQLDIVQVLYETQSMAGDACSTEPMDLAVTSGHLAVAQWLNHAKAQSCSVEAVDHAATNGHFEMLQWMHSTQQLKCTTAAMVGAAENGHFEIVKWFHRTQHARCSIYAVREAADNGHLEPVC
ncbi:unnamed protein product [Phytophthora lilii]|uniref:Unnamed protein product n=1 Tax=Phytophthora lilii TaxID=2077276 RepID=A0A9W6TUQ6_9STRA|nr:unnamed protein product [Phytophthora lilii]